MVGPIRQKVKGFFLQNDLFFSIFFSFFVEIAQKKQDKKQKRLLVLQQKNQTEEAFYHTSRALEDLRSRQLDLFKQIERAAAKREDIEQEYQSRADILQHLELSESAFYILLISLIAPQKADVPHPPE